MGVRTADIGSHVRESVVEKWSGQCCCRKWYHRRWCSNFILEEFENKDDKIQDAHFYIAKDRTREWYKTKVRTVARSRSHKIITETPGLNGMAQSSSIKCFQLFTTNDMVK